MESEATVNGDPNPWSSDTNWTVVRGTLVNSITFESSFTADEGLKSPVKRPALILKPNAPDSNPCEITISFSRKHELRQIYVKSSARVYEIYSQSNLQSESEYLWTVRCSAATSDDDRDDDEVSNGSRDCDKTSKENNVGSEEEWVSVKGPDDSSSALIKPEFYEATAEISDLDPCLSITLRLLSVQSKDSVVVDEIFVFANPVGETKELENDKNTNANGSSLMAMLLPSLLQMPKTKTSNGAQEKSNSELPRKLNFEKPASLEASFSGFSNVESSKIESQSPQIERSVDQLFSRIDRIEGMFLRLEESLLKPIHSIEARLRRVEHQLEVLNGKTKNTDQASCSRFPAPKFSSVLSDSNSFPCRETVEPSHSEEFESNAKRFHSESDNNNDDDDDDEDDDDEEENRVSDMMAETPSVNQEPKRPLTVEDALASALAGLMMKYTPAFSMKVPEFLNSSFSSEANENDSPRVQQDDVGTGSVTNDSNHHSIASPPTLSVEDTNDLSRVRRDIEEADKAENENGFLFEEPSDDESSEKTAEEVNDKNEEEDYSATNQEEATSGADSDPVVEDGNTIVLPGILESLLAAPSKVDFELPVLDVKFRSLDSREASSTANPDPVVEDGNGIVLPGILESLLAASSKVDFELPVLDVKFRSLDSQEAYSTADPDPVVEDGNGIVLPEILESSLAAPSKVDFEMPVLDVKFRSLDSRDINFSLEALLSEFPESGEERIDTAARSENEDHDLISVEDSEPVGPLISTQLYMDFNYCSLQEPLSREDETPLASVIPCSHDSLPTTLI